MVKNSSGLQKIDGWMDEKIKGAYEMERARAEKLRRMSETTLICHIWANHVATCSDFISVGHLLSYFG